MVCPKCKYHISCFEDCERFNILTTPCESCGGAKVKVEYPSQSSPLPNFANQHIGCLFCDDVFKILVPLPETFEFQDEKAKEHKEDAKEEVQAPTEPIKTGEVAKKGEGIIIVKRKKKK